MAFMKSSRACLATAILVSAGWTATAAAQSLVFEAESLVRRSSGASTSLQTDPEASAGQWVLLNGDGVGDYMEFTVPNVPAGSYEIGVRFKTNTNRGQMHLVVDGTQLGGGIDQYSPPFFSDWTAGRVTFAAEGTHVFRLLVIGHTSISSSYRLSADAFTLVPSAPPAPTVVVEAEDANPIGSGATATTAAVAGASGGVVQYLNADSVGDTLTLTTPLIVPGNYLIKFRYRTNTTRGRHSLNLSGNEIYLDQYASSAQFMEVTLPVMVMEAPMQHTIVLKVTGKNPSSSGYNLSADRITFIGQ